MPYCTDCIHCHIPSFAVGDDHASHVLAECRHQDAQGPSRLRSLVTGGYPLSCYQARSLPFCGSVGLLFERSRAATIMGLAFPEGE